ncbi:PEP-CTERM putative exosortase interaction domain-containing protein [Opitutaceae bacterium TAV1]|nr:PEP-CTERM putative exosortase interaction domain-containing protein [Opitutaceae bacterium TAV1]
MKTHFITQSAFLATLLFAATALHASVIFTDDFSYNLGNLGGQGSWTGSGGTVAAPTEPFANFNPGGGLEVSSAGNQATISGTVTTGITATPSGDGATFFVSFVGQVNNGNQYAGLRLQNASSAGDLLFGQTWNSPNWGVSINNANTQSGISNANVSLLVAQITYTGAATGTINLYINPTVSASGVISSAPALSLTGIDLNANGYNQVVLNGSASTLNIDSIRIGTTLADVLTFAPIPEPATYALFIAVGVLVCAMKRRISNK